MTSRGCTADAFELMADLVCEGVTLTQNLDASIGAKKLVDFKAAISKDEPSIAALRGRVEEFAMQFPTVGYDRGTMRYPAL